MKRFKIVIKRCLNCDQDYEKTQKNSRYCSQKCRSEHNRKKRRRKRHLEEPQKKIYQWACQECGTKIKLNFNPLKEYMKIRELECPKCKTKSQ